jgi:hypothetical protein
MTYGMLAAKSCLLTSIVDQLHERTKKVNAVERLGRHLCEGIPEAAKNEYHRFIWTSTSDGYGEDNRKEDIENSLMGEMKDILEHDNPDDFWEENSWNEDWKPMPLDK